MFKPLILFIALISFSFWSRGQNQYSIDSTLKSNTSIRVGYSPSRVIATNDFLRTENKNGSPITQGHAISAEIIFQTTGRKYWHQLYNFPKFGFGITHLWFPQTNELGSPIGLYSFLESPIQKWKKSDLNWVFDFGIGLGWNAYDSLTNPYNVLLGSTGSFFANFSVVYHYQFNKRFGADASIGFTHSSNGALKMPNYGINILYPRLALTYHLKSVQQLPKPRKLPPFIPNNEISLTYALGTKQIDVTGSDNDSLKQEFKSTNFQLYSIILMYQRQVSRLSKVGIGLDFTMDPSDNADGLVTGDLSSEYPPDFAEKVKFAIVLSYELAIGKLALICQPAFYFHRTTHDPTPFFYQRIGTRYDIYKGIYAGASLRAVNFGQADWVEFTVGYKAKF